jgi:GntR family transcriptional regulator
MSNACDPELTLQGGMAIYRQILTGIRDAIASGRLLPGEQLPTIRATAVELSVNPAVVAKAYQELEREGFVTSAEGSGTFVAPRPRGRADMAEVHPQAEYWVEFERLCQEFLAQAARYGFTSSDVIDALTTLTNGGCHERT